MSEKKHIFRMVPGKVFDNIEVAVRVKQKKIYAIDKIARVEFKSLDSESTIQPELQVRICTIRNNGKLSKSCIADDGKGLVKVEDKTGTNSFLYYDNKLMHAFFTTLLLPTSIKYMSKFPSFC